jgi:hypothetical protein
MKIPAHHRLVKVRLSTPIDFQELSHYITYLNEIFYQANSDKSPLSSIELVHNEVWDYCEDEYSIEYFVTLKGEALENSKIKNRKERARKKADKEAFIERQTQADLSLLQELKDKYEN